MNTITKEQARERMEAKGYNLEHILNILFPPFKPKEGEVIAVRNTSRWVYREFIRKASSGYVCVSEVSPSSPHTFGEARPLTDKEKGL